MLKAQVLRACMCSAAMLFMVGCGRHNRIPTSPVFEGRQRTWLTDGTVAVRAVDFHESFGTAPGPFGLGPGPSLAMTCEVANAGTSPVRFDRVGVEFQTSTIGKRNEFFTSANTMTVVTAKGYATYYGGPFGEKPKPPRNKVEPFAIPPARSVRLEVSGTGTPLQLVAERAGARREYRAIVTLYSGDVIAHGPFTIAVTAREGGDKRTLIFE